jgi:hypothetical protein
VFGTITPTLNLFPRIRTARYLARTLGARLTRPTSEGSLCSQDENFRTTSPKVLSPDSSAVKSAARIHPGSSRRIRRSSDRGRDASSICSVAQRVSRSLMRLEARTGISCDFEPRLPPFSPRGSPESPMGILKGSLRSSRSARLYRRKASGGNKRCPAKARSETR